MSLLVNWLESMHVDMNVTRQCSRLRNRHSTCRFCVDACETKALSIVEGTINVNHDKCSNCGTCVIACPLSAIEGVVSGRQFEGTSLLYSPGYTPVVKELLIYKKRGVNQIKTNGLSFKSEWMEVLQETNQLLSKLNELPLELNDDCQESAPLSRRALFASLKKGGRHLAKEMAPAAWKVNNHAWKLEYFYPDFQFYEIVIDKTKCTICQACLSYCTQSVFQLTDSHMQINSRHCVGCSDCKDICPESAVYIKPSVRKEYQIQEIIEANTCDMCGQIFLSFMKDSPTCPICSDRDDGWLGPHI